MSDCRAADEWTQRNVLRELIVRFLVWSSAASLLERDQAVEGFLRILMLWVQTQPHAGYCHTCLQLKSHLDFSRKYLFLWVCVLCVYRTWVCVLAGLRPVLAETEGWIWESSDGDVCAAAVNGTWQDGEWWWGWVMGTQGEFWAWAPASCNSLQVMESVQCHTNLHLQTRRLPQAALTAKERHSNYKRIVTHYSDKYFPQLPAKQTGSEPEFKWNFVAEIWAVCAAFCLLSMSSELEGEAGSRRSWKTQHKLCMSLCMELVFNLRVWCGMKSSAQQKQLKLVSLCGSVTSDTWASISGQQEGVIISIITGSVMDKLWYTLWKYSGWLDDWTNILTIGNELKPPPVGFVGADFGLFFTFYFAKLMVHLLENFPQ